jgi:hypothetical protein
MTHHFMQDKLMTVTPESESSSGDNVHWIFKNKDDGKTSATASLVCLLHRQWPAALASIVKPPMSFHLLRPCVSSSGCIGPLQSTAQVRITYLDEKHRSHLNAYMYPVE